MDDRETMRRASEQLAAIKGFYIHLAIFVLVNALLVGINWMAGPPWWAQYPLLGWGAGVAGHALAVFVGGSAAAARWEERKLAQIKRRLEAAGTAAI